jgi:diguanylate cyclase (GGDEF)-like protein
MRRVVELFIPGGLVLLAALVFLRPGVLPESAAPLLRVYPYAVAGIGGFLGWYFNRSRVVFGLLILAIADRVLVVFPPALGPGGGAGRTAFNAVALLLPINLAAYSLLSERGVITRRAAARLIPMLGQVLVVGLLWLFRRRELDTLLDYRFVGVDLTAWTPISQPALLAFGVAFVLLAYRFFLIRNPIERSFVWALAAVFTALQASGSGWNVTAFFATAGLILGISVIEMSYRMAYYDELTGLPGRRALNETLLKLGSQYAVGMVDVDHFKQFNDRYGHDVGDQVLRMVASKLEQASGGGKAFRYGGEEFAVVFPDQSATDTLLHLESLRREVQASCFVLRGPDRPKKKPDTPKPPSGPRKAVLVTVSIGVAAWDEQKRKADHVIKAADLALYRAKAAGRNKVKL